jgi:hypothetical protein
VGRADREAVIVAVAAAVGKAAAIAVANAARAARGKVMTA